MNTKTFAGRLGIQAQSVRARLSITGSYYGERPTTGPNGRLVWDDEAPERLLAQRNGARSKGPMNSSAKEGA